MLWVCLAVFRTSSLSRVPLPPRFVTAAAPLACRSLKGVEVHALRIRSGARPGSPSAACAPPVNRPFGRKRSCGGGCRAHAAKAEA
eukprot:7388710-Prymnesium_polylepis.1